MSQEYEAGADISAEDAAAADAMDALAGDAPIVDEKPVFEPTPEYDHEAAVAEAAKAKEVDDAPKDTTEALARAMGWSPKDQWRGQEDKWVDHKAFVERANPKQLVERMDKMQRDNEAVIRNMERMNTQALERQRAELQQERDWRIAEAVKAGNVAEVNRVNQAYETANKELDAVPVDNRAEEATQAQQSWGKIEHIQKDPIYAAAAYAICEQNKDKPMSEQLALVDKQLSKRFPEIYDEPEPPKQVNAPPAGQRSMDGVRVSGSRSTNYAAKLPASAKAQGERFVKDGLFPNLEAYAKEYVNG